MIANYGNLNQEQEEHLLSDGKNDKLCTHCRTYHPDWYICPEKDRIRHAAQAVEENRALNRLRNNKQFDVMLREARKKSDAMMRLERQLKELGWDGTEPDIPGFEDEIPESDPED